MAFKNAKANFAHARSAMTKAKDPAKSAYARRKNYEVAKVEKAKGKIKVAIGLAMKQGDYSGMKKNLNSAVRQMNHIAYGSKKQSRRSGPYLLNDVIDI